MFEQGNCFHFPFDTSFPFFSLFFFYSQIPWCHGSVRSCCLLGEGSDYWFLPCLEWLNPKAQIATGSLHRGNRGLAQGLVCNRGTTWRERELWRASAWTGSSSLRTWGGILSTCYKLLKTRGSIYSFFFEGPQNTIFEWLLMAKNPSTCDSSWQL